MTTTSRTILFAGGGSGGHIFPNLAVLERLREAEPGGAGGPGVSAHFLVSQRPLDEHILAKEGQPFTALPALPLVFRPKALLRFYQAYKQSEQAALELIARTNASAMVATGGYVSGPAVSAAHKAQIPVALLNLDAVPGRANRFLANKATEVFTVYSTDQLRRAQQIGMPLRRSAIGKVGVEKARWDLGLRPDLETILVFAGSQGATSINQMMMELFTRAQHRQAVSNWQVIHLTGPGEQAVVQRAYEQAGVRARVEAFCNQMGLVWSAATVAISRAGAGSVAEAWANAVPTIFMPYPYHKDEHQRFNAEPIVNAGAALLHHDLIDPIENVNQIAGPLKALMSNEHRLSKMRAQLSDSRPPDGAAVVADWLTTMTGVGLGRKMGG